MPLVLAVLLSLPAIGHAQNVHLLAPLSLDSLLGMKISVAARYQQTTRNAPAAITILTRDPPRAGGSAAPCP